MGNSVICKIKEYEKREGHIPNSLLDIGIVEHEEMPLYYDKRDSTTFILWFGTSLGASKTYYSDSNKWEDGIR